MCPEKKIVAKNVSRRTTEKIKNESGRENAE